MPTYARIQDGVVAELFTTAGDITRMFAPQLVWVDTQGSSAAVPGALYAGGVFSAPTLSLAQAQAAQLALMLQGYLGAIAQDVSFTTAAGVAQTFQADPDSVDKAQKMVAAYTASGVPAGFYWISTDNTRVAFTTADLQGLAKAMGDQGWAAFQRLQDRKTSIRNATTVAAVQAIVW